MGTVPVQRTWVTGEVVTAAEMNSNIRDAVNFLLTSPRFQGIINYTFNMLDSATPLQLFFSSALVDSDSMLNALPNNNQVICHTAGRFEFEFVIAYPSSAAIGTVQSGIQKNNGSSWGTGKFVEDTRQMTGSNNDGIYGNVSSCRGDQFMNVNDYVTYWAAQSGSGGTFSMQPSSLTFRLLGSARWIASS